MPQTRPELRVEGSDDKHTLIHLLIHNGVDCDPKSSPPSYPNIKDVGGVTQLLESMTLSVKVNTGRPVGFVLDADSPLLNRWSAIRNQLILVGVDVPDNPPTGGFIGNSTKYGTKVGVWLMPNNQTDGKLEDLLSLLISEADKTIEHAKSATDTAKELGAVFTDNDRIKAVLHTWLAWQEEPGLPYGTAVRAKYFRHDHQLVERFVEWFKALYGIT